MAVAERAKTLAGDVVGQLPPATVDALVLLAATAMVVPVMSNLNLSPILGFLLVGLVLGPNGLHLVRDVHTTEVFAELGVVFFLFEMGLELSIERLKSLSKDAFGLGSFQFVLTTLALAVGGELVFGLPRAAALVIGGSLALSSSAFVIQLLQERQELATRFGRASFGILLFQDIAVVPLLVLVPLLGTGGSGASLGTVLMTAAAKSALALSLIAGLGPLCLRQAYQAVSNSRSQEAFVAITLCTVLSMSTFTKALGLSDTLGAFLAGVLLAESKYRYQIEADIAPFRGILFGLFFITIGYAIDLKLLFANLPVLSLVFVLLHVLKAGLLFIICRVAKLTTKASIRTGILLSQAGEFAFVLFGLAQQHGVIDPALAKLLLLLAALSMTATPFLADLGAVAANSWDRRRKRLGDSDEDVDILEEDTPDGQVLVCGYGRVGQVVCDLLANMFVRYAACDNNAERVRVARERGLPVYFGDARRPDVLRAFGLLKGAKAVVVALDKPSDCLKVVKGLRRDYPDLPIFVRASDEKNRQMLAQEQAKGIVTGPQESALLLGAAVLKSTGKNDLEVISLIEEERNRLYMETMADVLGLVEVMGEPDTPRPTELAEIVDTIATEETQNATLEAGSSRANPKGWKKPGDAAGE